MIAVILMNSITLSLYDYSDRNSLGSLNQFLDKLNVGFTSFFISEALIKIVANGFIIHKESYMRNGWNLIDSVVVISG